MHEYRYERPLEDLEAYSLRVYMADCGMTGADVGRVLGLGKKAGNYRLNHPEAITAEELGVLLEAIRSKVCSEAVEHGVFADLEKAQTVFDGLEDTSARHMTDIRNASTKILSLEKDNWSPRFNIAATSVWAIDRTAFLYSEERVQEAVERVELLLLDINHIISQMNVNELEALRNQLTKKYPSYYSRPSPEYEALGDDYDESRSKE